MRDGRELLPLLTVISGPLQGASFRLGPGVRVIGRAAGADVPLDDAKVSRRHATVAVRDGTVLLADAGSTNGTWLNQRRLTEPRELCDGDRLRVGQVELRFFDPATAATVPVAGRYGPGPAPAGPPPGSPPPDSPAAGSSRPGNSPPGSPPPGNPAAAVTAVTATGRPGRMLWVVVGLLAAVGLAWAYLALA